MSEQAIGRVLEAGDVIDNEIVTGYELELQYPPRERVHLKLSVNKSGEDQNKWQRNCPIALCSVRIHCVLSVTLHPSTVSFN